MINSSGNNNFEISQDKSNLKLEQKKDKNSVNEKIEQINVNLTKEEVENENCIEERKISYRKRTPTPTLKLSSDFEIVSECETEIDLGNSGDSDENFGEAKNFSNEKNGDFPSIESIALTSILSHQEEISNVTDHSFEEFKHLLRQSGYQDFTRFNNKFLFDQGVLFQDLQNNPSLRKLLREWLQYPSVSSRNPQFTFLLKALNAFEKCPANFKIEKNLLSALYLMGNGNLRSYQNIDSKSNPRLTKFKGHYYTIVIDKLTGSLVRLQSFLDKGTYKRVKKVLDFVVFRIDAVGRQDVHPLNPLLARQFIIREIVKMRECARVEHVIQLISGFIYKSTNGKEKALIITPYCNKGTLKNQLGKLSEIEKYLVAIQISKGILNLNQKKIIHRDLKPENIYLHREIGRDGNEGELTVFIADFGLSCFSLGDPLTVNPAGSPLYMPPEKLKFFVDNTVRQNSGFESDAWSFGILLSEMFQTPFILSEIGTYKNPIELYNCLINNIGKFPKPIDEFSIDYIIWALTRLNPSERMLVQEALDLLVKIFGVKFPQ